MAFNSNDSHTIRSQSNGGSNIFSHYQEQEGEEAHLRRTAEVERVRQSNYQTGNHQAVHDNYNQIQDDFAANRTRNRGGGAPFATSNAMIDNHSSSKLDSSTNVAPNVAQDFRGGDYASNRARNMGSGAPFATGESMVESKPVRQNDPPNQYTPASDNYCTPKERQAKNPNLNRNTFQDLFGVEESAVHEDNRGKAKPSTHNPVTWEAYGNYDAEADRPAHKSRYETSAGSRARQGGFNPLNPGDDPNEESARRSAKGSAKSASTISNITF